MGKRGGAARQHTWVESFEDIPQAPITHRLLFQQLVAPNAALLGRKEFQMVCRLQTTGIGKASAACVQTEPCQHNHLRQTYMFIYQLPTLR